MGFFTAVDMNIEAILEKPKRFYNGGNERVTGGKLNRPTIIIDGVAGSGKTTLARYIANQTNSTVISGDTFMIEGVSQPQNQVELGHLFGQRPRGEDPGRYLEQHLFSKPDEQKLLAFLDIVRPYVEEQCVLTKEKLSKNTIAGVNLDALHNYEPDTRAFIIEWITSSKFEKEWQDATRRCVIWAFVDKVLGNTDIRGRADDAPELTEAKFNGIMTTVGRARNIDYPILDKGSKEELLKQAKPIIADVKEMTN